MFLIMSIETCGRKGGALGGLLLAVVRRVVFWGRTMVLRSPDILAFTGLGRGLLAGGVGDLIERFTENLTPYEPLEMLLFAWPHNEMESLRRANPNTSSTIKLPPSLRSDDCSRSVRNAVRVAFGISVRLRQNPHYSDQRPLADRLAPQ